jgi:hypothetical protein
MSDEEACKGYYCRCYSCKSIFTSDNKRAVVCSSCIRSSTLEKERDILLDKLKGGQVAPKKVRCTCGGPNCRRYLR